MTDLATLDLVLRAATVALAAAAAIAIARTPHRSLAAVYAAFVVAGIGVFMMASAPGIYAALGPLAFVLNAWCLATPAIVWMLARLLFRDGATPALAHFAAVAVLVAVTMAGDYGRFQLGLLAEHPGIAHGLLLAGRAVAVALLLAACAMAVMHWREDLVEQRRRARAVFVGIVGAVFVSFAGSELVFGGRAPMEALLAGHALLLLLCFALLQAPARGALAELLAEAPPRNAPLTIVRSDGVEAALARRVLAEMESRKLWKRDGLGIAELAREINTQEHRLRRAINRHLGYRNFNEFLHDYRLREAAARLADPREAHLPVLTIALDCGYGSIGPFNRAFKARFGTTPTHYRNRPDFALIRRA